MQLHGASFELASVQEWKGLMALRIEWVSMWSLGPLLL
jgi:hypothetical protein